MAQDRSIAFGDAGGHVESNLHRSAATPGNSSRLGTDKLETW
jgi:hypothetical protein